MQTPSLGATPQNWLQCTERKAAMHRPMCPASGTRTECEIPKSRRARVKPWRPQKMWHRSLLETNTTYMCLKASGLSPVCERLPTIWLQALDEYVFGMLRNVETDLGAVRAAQQRTTAAQLGISALDPMDELDSLPERIRFINRLAAEVLPCCLRAPHLPLRVSD